VAATTGFSIDMTGLSPVWACWWDYEERLDPTSTGTTKTFILTSGLRRTILDYLPSLSLVLLQLNTEIPFRSITSNKRLAAPPGFFTPCSHC
jgi:hypothetical protein